MIAERIFRDDDTASQITIDEYDRQYSTPRPRLPHRFARVPELPESVPQDWDPVLPVAVLVNTKGWAKCVEAAATDSIVISPTTVDAGYVTPSGQFAIEIKGMISYTLYLAPSFPSSGAVVITAADAEDSLPAEVRALASHHHASHCLDEVYQLTLKSFPGQVKVEAAEDPEIPGETYIVFRVQAAGDVRGIADKQKEWHRNLLEIALGYAHLFRISIHAS